jgi:hypothetical protein
METQNLEMSSFLKTTNLLALNSWKKPCKFAMVGYTPHPHFFVSTPDHSLALVSLHRVF